MIGTTFEIPGKPFGKQRPRFTRTGRAYTPKETIAHEEAIRMIAKPKFPKPITGPARLTVWATFKPARSWTKKKTAEHLGRWHTMTPDGDNIVKAVSDALNGIAYQDDSQVAVMVCHKLWGPVAKTVVTVEPLEMVSVPLVGTIS